MTAPHWWPAYVGIGSNIDSPASQVQRAIENLSKLPQTILALESGTYLSAPMGPVEQPDFINAVVGLMTQLNPHDLLSALQSIEHQQGRDRSVERWGPRTLDLDLLAYAGVCMNEDDLILPHPGIADRNFVLLPWAEIAPNFRVPGSATVTELAKAVAENPLEINKIG